MTPTLKHLAEETLRLAACATPGPWTVGEDAADGEVWDETDYKLVVHRIGRHPVAGNALFIAHARRAAVEMATALVELFAAADRLRRQQARTDTDLVPGLNTAIDDLLATLESP